MNAQYSKIDIGKLFTLDYTLYIKCNRTQRIISPFHDIPYVADSSGLFNMIVEIPRWTNAKMEISTTTLYSPIKQDKKNGKPRFVHNIFPHLGYPWNYGAIPQTWEDPHEVDKDAGAKGDNDPIDALEIGEKVLERGAIYTVKVIGCVALIDEGETDWKILTINSGDPLFDKIHTIADVNEHKPGLLEATVTWFKNYKVPAGKGYNSFAFDAQYKPADFATSVIHRCHKHWESLIGGKADPNGLSIKCTQVDNAVEKLSSSEVEEFTKKISEQSAKTPQTDAAQNLPADVLHQSFVH